MFPTAVGRTLDYLIGSPTGDGGAHGGSRARRDRDFELAHLSRFPPSSANAPRMRLPVLHRSSCAQSVRLPLDLDLGRALRRHRTEQEGGRSPRNERKRQSRFGALGPGTCEEVAIIWVTHAFSPRAAIFSSRSHRVLPSFLKG